MNITGGSTDVTTYVALTLLADGTDATGITITDLDLQYVRSGAAPAAKVDATALAATDSAHADNKAIEIDATDQPGLYRVDWPDAAFAAGVKEVVLSVKHTSCKTAHLRVTIDAPVNVTSMNADQQSLTDLKDFADAGYDPSTNKVQGVVLTDTVTNLTNLPTIPTDWITSAGLAASAVTEIQAGLATAAALDVVDNFLDTEIAAILAAVDTEIATLTTELAKVPKSDGTASWNATALAAIQTEAEDALVVHRLDELLNADSDIDGAAPPTVGSVFHELMSKTAGSFTFDQATDSLEAIRDRGDAAWITGSTHSAADVWAVATRLLTAGTNIVLAKGVGVTGFNDLDAAGIRSAVGLASANLDTQLSAIDDYIDTEIASLVTSVGAIWTTALTEAYRTDGSTGTGAQLLYEILAHHAEKSISGTTLTTKKLDGLTTAATHTLNSSSAPTSITRAS
jgi:predicted Fe-Mo cluster-binding NifX family protein